MFSPANTITLAITLSACNTHVVTNQPPQARWTAPTHTHTHSPPTIANGGQTHIHTHTIRGQINWRQRRRTTKFNYTYNSCIAVPVFLLFLFCRILSPAFDATNPDSGLMTLIFFSIYWTQPLPTSSPTWAPIAGWPKLSSWACNFKLKGSTQLNPRLDHRGRIDPGNGIMAQAVLANCSSASMLYAASVWYFLFGLCLASSGQIQLLIFYAFLSIAVRNIPSNAVRLVGLMVGGSVLCVVVVAMPADKKGFGRA